MSIFLSTEEIIDRPLGGNEQPQVPHLVGNILYVILGALFKLLFRYRVDNRETLRDFIGKSGVVVVGNHTSYLDVVFLYLAVRPSQWIRFMARDNLFEHAHGFLGQIIARVGAFPVKRDSADLTSVKRAAKMLKRGEVVGIFPEGTRRGKGSQEPTLHGGAAMVAKMGHAPILPVTVRNAENIKQKGKFIRFPKVTIEFGTPFSLDAFEFVPKQQRYEAASWYAMRECYALSRYIPAEEVDMASLFPDSPDFSELFQDRVIVDDAQTYAQPSSLVGEEADDVAQTVNADDQGKAE